MDALVNHNGFVSEEELIKIFGDDAGHFGVMYDKLGKDEFVEGWKEGMKKSDDADLEEYVKTAEDKGKWEKAVREKTITKKQKKVLAIFFDAMYREFGPADINGSIDKIYGKCEDTLKALGIDEQQEEEWSEGIVEADAGAAYLNDL